MKIATKLRIAALAPVVMALVAGIALGFSNHALATAQKRIKNVSDVVTSVNNLNTLVYSYMLHHEERPKQQFMTEQEKISKELSSMNFSDLDQNRMLYRLRSDVKSMKGLFVKMAASYESVRMTAADVTVREAGERLGGQLLAASSQTVADGLALTRAVNDRAAANQRRLYQLIFFLVLSTTVVITYSVAGMVTNVSRSFAKLARGADIIGSGNLDYRLGITSQDELGDVARSFDVMATRLADSLAGLQKREEELRHSETRLRLAIEATGMGTFEFVPLTGELVWSDLAKLHFGLPPEADVNFDRFLQGLHPDDRERVQAIVQDVLQPGSDGTYAAEYRTIGIEDGRERWLSARGLVLFEDGQPYRLIGATLDITGRKLAEEALRIRESDLARAQAAAHLGSWRWDLRSDLVSWSEELYRIFGVDPATFVPTNAAANALIHPDYRARHAELASLALTGQEAPPFESRIIRPSGEERVVLASGFEAEFDRQGKPLVLFGTILDITERKRMDEALRKAKEELEVRVEERTRELTRALQQLREESDQRVRAVEELRNREQMLIQQSRLAAMGEMLVNISHQWRQPLNVVGILLQDLTRGQQRGTFTPELLEKNVSRARELISHMSHTIDDFRSYLNPEKTRLPFDLREVVNRTLSLVGESLRGVQVEVLSPEEQPIIVHGFRNEYAQVLINILMNARDAFRERGIQAPRITVTIAKEDRASVVTIADNAGGIAADVIDRVFEPYFTTKGPDKGTGIGLFMSRNIIEKNMAGRLTVRNTAQGAEFRIEV